VPLVCGLFDRFRPPPALAARCGIVVRRRIHVPGRPFARSRSGERCQGFSPLQPRCRFSVRHDSTGLRTQRSRTPCAHRLGERTKRQRLGRVIVAPRPDPNASWQSRLVRSARAPRPSRACLALTKAQDPTRLPRIRFSGPITNQLVCRLITEGLTPALRPLLARSTLLRRTMTTCPVPGDWPSPPLDSAPRSASRPTLGRSAKMPRIRLYNRRFALRAPMSKHHLRRLPPSAVGKPADVRLPDRLLERGRAWRSRFLGRRRTTLRSSGLQQLRA
jgi:hypothetical protein